MSDFHSKAETIKRAAEAKARKRLPGHQVGVLRASLDALRVSVAELRGEATRCPCRRFDGSPCIVPDTQSEEHPTPCLHRREGDPDYDEDREEM